MYVHVCQMRTNNNYDKTKIIEQNNSSHLPAEVTDKVKFAIYCFRSY